jgi:hypothetical protein
MFAFISSRVLYRSCDPEGVRKIVVQEAEGIQEQRKM